MRTTDRFKKFTILHSNDMHGDFLAEAGGEEGHLIGECRCFPAISIKYARKRKTCFLSFQVTWCRVLSLIRNIEVFQL
jgi:hypothetical protein